MSIKFEFLPHAGEAILITTEEFTALVDGGSSHPFNSSKFKKTKKNIPDINIALITHIDHDHINGILKLLSDKNFTSKLKFLIFNEPKEAIIFTENIDSNLASAPQANLVSTYIRNLPHIEHINSFHTKTDTSKLLPNIKNSKITILSPTYQVLCELNRDWKLKHPDKDRRSATEHNRDGSIELLAQLPFEPDKSLPNKSSIAFIIEHNKRSFLLLGDAHIDKITAELKSLKEMGQHNLKFDFIKLSHHGKRSRYL